MSEKSNPLFWQFCSIRWVGTQHDTKEAGTTGRPPQPPHWETYVRTPYGKFILDFPSRVRAAEYADIVKLAMMEQNLLRNSTRPVKFNFPRDHYPGDIKPLVGSKLRQFLDKANHKLNSKLQTQPATK